MSYRTCKTLFFNISTMYKYYVQMGWLLSGMEHIGDQKLSFINNLGNTEVRAVLFTVLYALMFCGEACRADIPVSILYKETGAGE